MALVRNNIAVGRDTQVWVVPEITFGAFVAPNSTHSVLISDGGSFNQVANLIDDAQKRPVRSRFAQIRGKYNPADWAFSTYFKPQTPVVATANNEHLLEGLFGSRTHTALANATLVVNNQTGVFLAGEPVTGSVAGAGTVGSVTGGAVHQSAVTTAFVDGEVVTGGTSGAVATVVSVIANANVAFTPTDTIQSYCIYANVGGHTCLMLRGVTINQGVFTINGVDIANASWSGQAIEMRWTGTSPLTAAVAPAATTAIVTDATLYSVDSLVQITSPTGAVIDDNGGVGYHVSAVDTLTKTITIDTVGGFTSGDAGTGNLAPWYPNVVESGTIVHGRQGTVSLNNAVLAVTDSTITVTNNIQYVIDEKDGSDFASVVSSPGLRTVDGTVAMYFRPADTRYYTVGKVSEQAPVRINLGTVANQRYSLFLPSAVFTIPTLDQAEMISLSTELRAEASNSEVAGEIIVIGD